MKRTCNQCGGQMELLSLNHRRPKDLMCCENPRCPNYALAQIAVEQMPKEKKKGKRNET